MDTFSKKKAVFEETDAQDAPRPYKAEIVADLIALDRDIMKLLVRRGKLVHKLRGGREYAASPAAAGAEKAVRTAWEKNAAAFSRDEKFARQLFTLLQEVRVDSHADAAARSSFNLAPSRRAVSVTIPGPRSTTATRMFAALAAWFGEALVLDGVLLNDPLMDSVKAFNNAGARFTWTAGERAGEGSLRHAVGKSASLITDKALYVGEDVMTIYLMAFLAASGTGKARFTGGARLKMADLSPLRRFLPELGARFAHSMPKVNGLPGSVEASGLLPDAISVPADLPREGVMALFGAVAAWRKRVTLDCAALPLPLFSSAFAECLPVLRACSVEDSVSGTVVTLDATRASLPETVVCPLDPVLSAYLLALPAFAGGTVSLAGAWDAAFPQAASVLDILTSGGITVGVGKESVTGSPAPNGAGSGAAIDLREADAPLVPLGLALAAHRAASGKTAVPLPLLPDHLDPSVAEGFCAHIGLMCRDGVLSPASAPREDEEKSSWTAPSPEWAFAYALCAYDRPNLHLTNPAVVTSLMPSFWALYNALPDPSAKKALAGEEKPRRRIRAE